jgi:hypothetical protein
MYVIVVVVNYTTYIVMLPMLLGHTLEFHYQDYSSWLADMEWCVPL